MNFSVHKSTNGCFCVRISRCLFYVFYLHSVEISCLSLHCDLQHKHELSDTLKSADRLRVLQTMTCANDVCAQSKAAHCEPCMESPAVHIQMEHWQVQDEGWFTVEDIAKILGYCAGCMSYVCFYIYVRVPGRRFICILFSIFNPPHVKFPPLEVFGIKTKQTRSLQARGRLWEVRGWGNVSNFCSKNFPSSTRVFHWCTAVQLGENSNQLRTRQTVEKGDK